jgi:hypothetical protein
MSNVITQYEWAREKLFRDIVAYLGGGPDLETLHHAYLGWRWGFPDEVIKEAWAEARAEMKRRQERSNAG